MYFTIKNGKSTVLIHQLSGDDEFPGQGKIIIPFDIGRKYLQTGPITLNVYGEPLVPVQYYWDQIEKEDGPEGRNLSGFSLNDSDSWVYLFHKLRNENGVFQFEMEMENPYWIFHDLDHAKHDVNDDILFVDADIEIRAYVNGAKAAKKNGVSNRQIYEALNSIQEDFTARFKRHPCSWPEFARCLEKYAKLAGMPLYLDY